MRWQGAGALGAAFDRALVLAADWHRDQLRKNGNVPYISHLLRVAGLALDYGASEEVAIAALLHDAVEDCGGLPIAEKIRAEFGDFVAQIVLETSDSTSADKNDKAPWEERKTAYLARLETGLPEAALICGCDKLDNATALIRALRNAEPGSVWAKFKRGPEKTVWFFESIATILTKREIPVAEELSDVVERLAAFLNAERSNCGVQEKNGGKNANRMGNATL